MLESSLFKIAQICLPHNKRTTRQKAWVKVFVSYLAMITEQLRHFRANSLIEAYMTPQVIYLEKYLNNRYGTTGISIIEGYDIGAWIFPTAESGEYYMDWTDDYVFGGDDETYISFQVRIPPSLVSSRPTATSEIIAMVSKFKMVGKKFGIKIV